MGQKPLQVHAVVATMMALKAMDLDVNTCVVVFGDVVEIVKPCGQAWDSRHAMSLLTTLSSFEANLSLDADGIAVASALLEATATGRGPSFVFAFTDGYGNRGLRLTATLAQVASRGTTVVGVGVGGDGTQHGNGLAHSFAHWVVCNRLSALPAALRAWGNAFHGVDALVGPAPDPAGFAAAEFMSHTLDGVKSMDDVWEKEHGGYFKSLDAQLNEQRMVFVKPGGKESGGGCIEIDIAFLMDCT